MAKAKKKKSRRGSRSKRTARSASSKGSSSSRRTSRKTTGRTASRGAAKPAAEKQAAPEQGIEAEVGDAQASPEPGVQYEDPVNTAISEVTGKLSGAYAEHKARIDLFVKFVYGQKTQLTAKDRQALELGYLITAAEKLVEGAKGKGYEALVAVVGDEEKTEISDDEKKNLHDYKDIAEALCGMRKTLSDYEKAKEAEEKAEKVLKSPYEVVAAAGSVDDMLKDASKKKKERTAMDKAMKTEPENVYAVAAKSTSVAEALVSATLEDGKPTDLTARVNARIGRQRVYVSLVGLESEASTAFEYDPKPAKAEPKKKAK